MDEKQEVYLKSIKKLLIRKLLPNNLYSQVCNPIIYSIVYDNKEVTENIQKIKTSSIIWFNQTYDILENFNKLIQRDQLQFLNYNKFYNLVRWLASFSGKVANYVEERKVPELNYLGPGFKRLLQDISKNNINKVVVVTLDRISRFWGDILFAISEIERYNADLVVVNRSNLDSKFLTPYKRLDYLYRGLLNPDEILLNLKSEKYSTKIYSELIDVWLMETEFIIEAFRDFSDKIPTIYGFEERELSNKLQKIADLCYKIIDTIDKSGKQIIEVKAQLEYEAILEDEAQVYIFNLLRWKKKSKQKLRDFIISLFNKRDNSKMAQFEALNHLDDITKFVEWIKKECAIRGVNCKINITHGLNDSGVDVFIEFSGDIIGVVGFQIKSHDEILKNDFNDVMSRDIADSDRQNIDLYSIIFCANKDCKDKKIIEQKIPYQVNRINQKQTRDFFICIEPEEATIFL